MARIQAASDPRIVGKTDEEAHQIALMDLKDKRIVELEEEVAHWRDVEDLQRRRYIEGAEMWWAAHPAHGKYAGWRRTWPDLGELVTYLTGKAAGIAETEERVKRLRRVGRAAQAIPWAARSRVSVYDDELYKAQAALEPGDTGEDTDGAQS